MDVWNDTSMWLELALNGALLVIPALAALEGAARVTRRARYVWKNIVRKAVDEPGDLAVFQLAQLSGRTPAEVSRHLVQSGDSIIALFPAEADPLAERIG